MLGWPGTLKVWLLGYFVKCAEKTASPFRLPFIRRRILLLAVDNPFIARLPRQNWLLHGTFLAESPVHNWLLHGTDQSRSTDNTLLHCPVRQNYLLHRSNRNELLHRPSSENFRLGLRAVDCFTVA